MIRIKRKPFNYFSDAALVILFSWRLMTSGFSPVGWSAVIYAGLLIAAGYLFIRNLIRSDYLIIRDGKVIKTGDFYSKDVFLLEEVRDFTVSHGLFFGFFFLLHNGRKVRLNPFNFSDKEIASIEEIIQHGKQHPVPSS